MHEFNLKPLPPFDFATTARFFRFTEAELVDTFEGGVYARACWLEGKLLLVSVSSEGTTARPSLAVTLEPARNVTPRVRAASEEFVGRAFSLEHDLRDFRARVADDPLLSRLEAAHRGLRLARWPTLFEALAASILLQQISTAGAWTLKRRLVERFGESARFGGREFYAFPRPEALARAPIEEVRAVGLSNAKAAALVEMARAVESGALDGAALACEDNETIIARLSELRGVGRWTAEWALMLHFGRRDVFAAGDLFLRGAVAKYYNGGEAMSEREVRELAARRWGSWQSYAAIYLLAGMRAGSVTLKPGRVLSSQARGTRRDAPESREDNSAVKRPARR
jgi:DNA-3-methyladenine glycosylase II